MQRLLAHFYSDGADAVRFSEDVDSERKGVSFWEKLKHSLSKNLPKDLMELHETRSAAGQTLAQVQMQQKALAHFWAFLSGLLVRA